MCAYNFFMRLPGLPLVVALIMGGLCATVFGILFGLPSLRVKGLYLAVATLAAQFFADWMFLRISWFTLDSTSGSAPVRWRLCKRLVSLLKAQRANTYFAWPY
jgi:branched-chain amino acid transport system permease protein